MLCSKCGKEIKEGSKFCRYCGKQIEIQTQEVRQGEVVSSDSKKKPLILLFSLFFFFIILYLLSLNDAKQNKENVNPVVSNKMVAPITPSVEDLPDMPSAQQSFLAMHVAACSSYESGANEIVQSKVYNIFMSDLASFFNNNSLTFEKWKGIISTIKTSKGGEELALMVNVGTHIKVYQLNIQPDSHIYNRVAEMRVGDTVSVSGMFSGKDGGFTERGTICDPDYSVVLTDIMR